MGIAVRLDYIILDVWGKIHTKSNSTDHDKILCYIKECRESTRYKSKDELKQFVAKIFDSSFVRMSRNNKQ